MSMFSNLLTPKPLNTSSLFKPQTQLNPSLFQAPKSNALSSLIGSNSVTTPKATAPVTTPVKPVVGTTKTVNTVNPNRGQIDSLTSQLSGLKSQLGQAQGAGYSGNDMIQHDAQGNVLPKVETPPATVAPPVPLYNQALNNLSETQATPQQNQSFDTLMSKTDSSPQIEEARANLAKQMGLDINTNAGLMGKPGPLEFNQGREQVAQQAQVQREAGLQGLLSNYLTGRGQDISAATNAGSQANTIAGQKIGAEGTVAGLTQPNAQGYPFVFNPETGKYEDATNGQYGSGVLAQQNIAIAKQFQGDYQSGLAKLRAADGIQNQIVDTLKANPQLNQTKLSTLTNLTELGSGLLSSSAQQLLTQQVESYIQALGLDPNAVFKVAQQQQQTLAQLLDSLRQTAQATVDSKDPSKLNFNSGSTTGPTTTSSTGDLNSSSQAILSKYGIK